MAQTPVAPKGRLRLAILALCVAPLLRRRDFGIFSFQCVLRTYAKRHLAQCAKSQPALAPSLQSADSELTGTRDPFAFVER